MGKRFAPDEMFVYMEFLILSGDHPALAGLGPICHSTYIKLCAKCWQLGREELTGGYLLVKTLCGVMDGMDRDVLIHTLGKLKGRGLLSLGELEGNPSGFRFLTVHSLRDKMRGRNWKAVRVEESRVDIKELRATPVLDQKPQNTEKPKRSIRQADQDRDIEDLRAAYAARFPKAPVLVESELGEILKGCKLREVSPAGLVAEVRQHVQKPMGMIRGYLLGKYPIPDGVPSWYSWCTRHNGSMKHISAMLPELERRV